MFDTTFGTGGPGGAGGGGSNAPSIAGGTLAFSGTG
jgi:hypothetical protein